MLWRLFCTGINRKISLFLQHQGISDKTERNRLERWSLSTGNSKRLNYLYIFDMIVSNRNIFIKKVMEMYKACSRCGKIHKSGYECNVGKVYQGGEERRLRSKYVWAKKSKAIREKANHLCEVCRDNGVYTYDGLEVHHIEKVKDAPAMLLDDSNLVCLCVEHHKQADNGQIDSEYLKQLAIKRETDKL